jgi:hypothetical protein
MGMSEPTMTAYAIQAGQFYGLNNFFLFPLDKVGAESRCVVIPYRILWHFSTEKSENVKGALLVGPPGRSPLRDRVIFPKAS